MNNAGAKNTAARRTRPAVPRAAASAALGKLAAVILLEGSVRGSDLAEAAGRSILELPVTNGLSLIDRWHEQVSELAAMLGVAQLPCCLLTSHDALEPRLSQAHRASGMRVQRDSSEFRGTGGVLRDFIVEQDHDGDALFLVASARQLLLEPLADLAVELAQCGEEVAITAYDDGSPSNLCLIPGDAVRRIPATGLVDFKDKGLATIAARNSVAVLRRPHGTAAPLRSLPEYIAALQSFHRVLGGQEARQAAFAEHWASTFSIVEPGGTVDSGARLHESVVLAGGHVSSGAAVVRSVVCAGGLVPANGRISGLLVNKAV